MKTLLIVFCLLLHHILPAQQLPDPRDREVVFLSVNVIPMDRDEVLMNKVVVVRNGRITAIGDQGSISFSGTAQMIDGSGKYLIPGLAEMHAHVPPNDNIAAIKEVLTLFAAGGVTTIRGMLGHPFHIGLRKSIASGEILGPRLYTSGPSFNGSSIKTTEEAVRKVKEQKEAGYDFLKMHPGLNKENFAAVTQTAKEVNIPFAGHVSYEVGVWNSINSGYASIDHLDGFADGLVTGTDSIKEADAGLFGMFLAGRIDDSKIPVLMQELKDKKVWVVPTQTLAERWFAPGKDGDWFERQPEHIYIKADVRTSWSNSKKNLVQNPRYTAEKINAYIALRRRLLLECQRNGVGILLGSDAPQVFNVPGFSVHDELQSYVNAGLTPYEALVTGTVNTGRYLGRPDLGVIRQGAVADLVLLEGNPLQDIGQTRRIAGVMLDGRWLPKDQIKIALRDISDR